MNGTNSAVLHKTDSLHEQMGAVICWGGSMKKTGFYDNPKIGIRRYKSEDRNPKIMNLKIMDLKI